MINYYGFAVLVLLDYRKSSDSALGKMETGKIDAVEIQTMTDTGITGLLLTVNYKTDTIRVCQTGIQMVFAVNKGLLYNLILGGAFVAKQKKEQKKVQKVIPVNTKAKDTFFKKVYEQGKRQCELVSFLLGIDVEKVSTANIRRICRSRISGAVA